MDVAVAISNAAVGTFTDARVGHASLLSTQARICPCSSAQRHGFATVHPTKVPLTVVFTYPTANPLVFYSTKLEQTFLRSDPYHITNFPIVKHD